MAWINRKRSSTGIALVGTIIRASVNALVSAAVRRVLTAIVVRRASTGAPRSSW